MSFQIEGCRLGRASVAQTMGWITNAPGVEASAGRLTYFILRAVSTNIDTAWSAPILLRTSLPKRRALQLGIRSFRCNCLVSAKELICVPDVGPIQLFSIDEDNFIDALDIRKI